MTTEERRRHDPFKWNYVKGLPRTGFYNMPVLQPCYYVGDCDIVPFSRAKREKLSGKKWISFFGEGEECESLWNNLRQYKKMVGRFQGCFGPDFRVGDGVIKIEQIWNCWRNNVITRNFQNWGAPVIPNVSLTREYCLEWVLPALPVNSVLATRLPDFKEFDAEFEHAWKYCLETVIKEKRPLLIHFFGRSWDVESLGFSVPFRFHHIEDGRQSFN